MQQIKVGGVDVNLESGFPVYERWVVLEKQEEGGL